MDDQEIVDYVARKIVELDKRGYPYSKIVTTLHAELNNTRRKLKPKRRAAIIREAVVNLVKMKEELSNAPST